VATVDSVRDSGPVIFNFFPGAREDEEVKVDGQTLRFKQVTLRADKLFQMENRFRIMNPYQMECTYTHKPVRCWLELGERETFVLEVSIAKHRD
jgi:hypothetical protein